MQTIKIDKSVKSSDWLRVAKNSLYKLSASLGVAFRDLECVVLLPESGRCFEKKSGRDEIVAHG